MRIHKSRVVRTILFGLVVLILCIGFCCIGLLAYLLIYQSVIPYAPIPEGAHLLARNPTDFTKWSSQASYSYFVKYSLKMSTEKVKEFYAKAGNRAIPWGNFSADVLLPTPSPDEAAPNLVLDSALRRDKSDPVGETLILIEVVWDADPPPLSRE